MHNQADKKLIKASLLLVGTFVPSHKLNKTNWPMLLYSTEPNPHGKDKKRHI